MADETRAARTVTRAERRRAFPSDQHPYRQIEAVVCALLPDAGTLLDIGCGRDATRLRRLLRPNQRGLGVDVDTFTPQALSDPRVTLTGVVGERWPTIADDSVDVAYSVSVFEHLADPAAVVTEAHRVLRPGGTLAVLTPNLFDYVSLASFVLPNALHPWLVARTEGRDPSKTFPTYYRANTRRRLTRLLVRGGFLTSRVEYLASPPSYLKFHPLAWQVGVAYHRAITAAAITAWLRGWVFAVATKPVSASDYPGEGRTPPNP